MWPFSLGTNKKRKSATRRPDHTNRLRIEMLEHRHLLSAGTLTTPPAWTVAPVGGETAAQQTNTVENTTSGGFYYPYAFNTGSVPNVMTSPRSVAMFGDGSSVVTWADVKSGGLTYNLMFQEYSASGASVGPGITVAAGNNLPGIMVAAQQTSSPGKFVIAWTTDTTPHKGSTYAVTHAEVWQFGSSPTLQASTAIGTSTAGFRAVSVAMDARGNFDLATDGLNVQRFTSAAVAQGPVINVASAVQPIDWGPATVGIAMDAAGDFAVGWSNTVTTYVYNGKNIVSSSYVSYIDAEKFVLNSSGTPVAQGVTTVGQSAVNGDHLAQADVGMDLAGDFVVSWRDAEINPTIVNGTTSGSVYASVYYTNPNGNGSVVGTTGPIDEVPITVGLGPNGTMATNFAVQDLIPAVVAQPNGGGAFDLAWAAVSVVYDSSTGKWAGYENVDAEQFASSGAASSQGPITVYQSQPNASGQRFPSAAVDANNDLMVVYSLNPGEAPPTGFTSANGNVFAQFYVDPPAPAPNTSSPTGGTSTSGPSTSGPSTSGPSTSGSPAVTDGVFANYAYPEEDDLLV